MLTITTYTHADVPRETDEYRREEQGTWTRELKWHCRSLAYEPTWYFNRLVALCALFWLFSSLVPDALAALKSAAMALIFTFSVTVRWMRELQLMLDYRAPEALLRSLM